MGVFFKDLKRMLISLRFSILTIFVTLFVASMMLLIGINYGYSSDTLLYTARTLMHEVTANLYEQFAREIDTAQRDNEFSAQLIDQGVVNANDFNELKQYTLDVARRFYVAHSTHWADKDGNVVGVRYDVDESMISEIIDRRKTPAMRTIIFRDYHENIRRILNTPEVTYDPRVRPWYIEAKKAGKTIWTDIYLYQPEDYLGVSVATPVYDKHGNFRGVFAVDIRLDYLSWYISKQKLSPNASIFVVTRDGKIVAFPKFEVHQDQAVMEDIHALPNRWLAKSFDLYKKLGDKEEEFQFDHENKTFLAVYKALPQFGKDIWYIGVVVPAEDFVGELKKTSLINMGISLIILAFGIAIVSTLVTRVVKPLKNLVKETDKIKNFDLDDKRKKIKSRIKEIMSLSNSIHAMKTGLRSFRRYVPAALVRQLIETGENARIGGTKKSLTILFTDIKNFTTLSEHMDPDLLMEHMCEYFEEMSNIIINEKGTIDKYIGDSIMAFWGAPFVVDNPVQNAAHAALKCTRKLEELNARWVKENKPVLVTRFGINAGDAIVGNVGSSERINYTAIGDAINVASRLEGINKLYGTRIIVSDVVYEIIKDSFVLRRLDCVAVKGKITSNDIYELLAEHKNELSFDIDQYQEVFEKAFNAYRQQRWDEAIALFNNCLTIYPQDSVAPVFIQRCQELKYSRPREWDGVWRIGG